MPPRQTRSRVSLLVLQVLFALSWLCGTAWGANSIPFVLDQAEINSNITRYSEYLRDRKGTLAIEDMAAIADGLPFRQASDMEWLGFSHDTWWVRFSLLNDTNIQRHVVLHLTAIQVAQITLFSPDGQGGYVRHFAGSEYFPPWGDIRYREPLFLLDLPPNRIQTFYLRILPKQSFIYGLHLSDETNLPVSLFANDIWLLASIGILLGFFLLNLGFLWRQQDVTYLFYAGFIGFAGLGCLTNLGYLGIEYLPLPGLQPRLEGFSISLAVLFSCGFTLLFLGLNQRRDTNLLALVLLALLACGSAVNVWFAEPTFGLKITYLLTALANVILCVIAMRCILEQRQHARIYLLAQMPLMLAATFSTLAQLGVLSVDFSFALVIIASICVESLILAIGFTQKNMDSAVNAMDRKHQREVEAQENRLRKEILVKLSHEIRTPMNGITGMTSLLADTTLTQAQQECLATIQDASSNLLHVVNNIINQGDNPAGGVLYQIFDLNQLLTSLIQLLQDQAREKHIEIVSYVHTNVPQHVRGQPAKVRQCLTNLLAACMQQSGAGDLILEVSLDPRGIRHSLLFRFEGSSLAADADWINLLEDPAQSNRQDRASVNLKLAHQFIADLGGSSGHNGAIPWVRLPLPAETSEQEPGPLDLQRMRGRTLLLLSNSQALVRILYRHTVSWGMSVTVSTKPIEALSGIRLQASVNEPYDAVVFDHRMAEMDGLALAQKIRDDSNLDRAMVLIMLTDDLEFHQHFQPGQHGIQQVLLKPVFAMQLGQALTDELAVLQPLAGGTNPHYDSLKVLVAEDHALSQKVICTMLNKLGAQVDVASNGREAVAAVHDQDYDLVFMDCEMPDVDGFEATRQIRAWEQAEERKPLPIIALTAHVLRIHQEQARMAGMNAHLAKPIDLKALRDVISQFMDARLDVVDGPSP